MGVRCADPSLLVRALFRQSPPGIVTLLINGECVKDLFYWVLLENIVWDISTIRGDTLTKCRFSLCCVDFGVWGGNSWIWSWWMKILGGVFLDSFDLGGIVGLCRFCWLVVCSCAWGGIGRNV